MVVSFGPIAGKTVLDVGCGGGILSEALALLGAQVTGIDADPATIATATAHAPPEASLRYVATACEALESPPFDIVVCMEMLEHVHHPELVIKHSAQHLKPGGLLLLSTINRTPQAYFGAIVMAEYVLNLLPKQTHTYEKCIRPSELSHMARQAGLEPIALTGMGFNPFTSKAYLRSSVLINYLMACRNNNVDAYF